MGLSSSQRFLIEAARSAGSGDYVRWHDVGAALGFTPDQSAAALESLGERKLLVPLRDGVARLSVDGRAFAGRLAAKAAPDGGRGLARRNPAARPAGGRGPH